MLNSKGERQLAYLVKIDDITPINGYDRVELAHVGGWTVVVGKNEFKAEDTAIYFEIDSKLPEKPPFSDMEFLVKKHYKIQTQKMCKGTVYSQGFLCSLDQLGWEDQGNGYVYDPKSGDHGLHYIKDERRFVTKDLDVTYAVKADNKRKASSIDKYKKMAQRHPNLFKKPVFRWLMRRNWGKKLLFVLFGKKRDKKSDWPTHIASKTDVERIQNMIWILKDKRPFVATEKIDGSSCSVMAEKKLFGKIKYYVCSRNVVFTNEEQQCFYDSNIYFEMYHKYNLKDKITQILKDLNLSNIALQMEVYGTNVQKRDYSLKDERRINIFHIVSSNQKFSMDKVIEICEKYDLPHVPIVNDNYTLPDTIEELQTFVENSLSAIDNKEKEGIVFYDKTTGQRYFKFVSPKYLTKYH